jgi:hypothetical protein
LNRNKKLFSPLWMNIHGSIHCITAFNHQREPVTCSLFLWGPDSGHGGA